MTARADLTVLPAVLLIVLGPAAGLRAPRLAADANITQSHGVLVEASDSELEMDTQPEGAEIFVCSHPERRSAERNKYEAEWSSGQSAEATCPDNLKCYSQRLKRYREKLENSIFNNYLGYRLDRGLTDRTIKTADGEVAERFNASAPWLSDYRFLCNSGGLAEAKSFLLKPMHEQRISGLINKAIQNSRSTVTAKDTAAQIEQMADDYSRLLELYNDNLERLVFSKCRCCAKYVKKVRETRKKGKKKKKDKEEPAREKVSEEELEKYRRKVLAEAESWQKSATSQAIRPVAVHPAPQAAGAIRPTAVTHAQQPPVQEDTIPREQNRRVTDTGSLPRTASSPASLAAAAAADDDKAPTTSTTSTSTTTQEEEQAKPVSPRDEQQQHQQQLQQEAAPDFERHPETGWYFDHTRETWFDRKSQTVWSDGLGEWVAPTPEQARLYFDSLYPMRTECCIKGGDTSCCSGFEPAPAQPPIEEAATHEVQPPPPSPLPKAVTPAPQAAKPVARAASKEEKGPE
ncbi:unnamed protein product [Vitrella brassicaformis CCMP3155]|uniref:WW domain-containing protein n=1 Tax=Vitrella brassicaformis (strain CCMP3155) TaxID=1169540 RepID=A0A0G4EEH3_VITBC|nr:unnamed protein product [Vitrella brassicaformis CCMP3155]|eukprot:CEL93769.1 unnamed protein product [Vitrella brassicaformis CCMP3155]